MEQVLHWQRIRATRIRTNSTKTCAALGQRNPGTRISKRLGQGLAPWRVGLRNHPPATMTWVAMEVATAILLLQNAQENFRHLGMDFAQQVDLMVARLYARIAGNPAGGNEELPFARRDDPTGSGKIAGRAGP